MSSDILIVGSGGASLEQVVGLLRGAGVELGPEALEAVSEARRLTEERAGGDRPVYGVNTGFGRLAGRIVDGSRLSELQRNLLLSHACGTGVLLERDVVRLLLFLRVASLARGRSGIRPETLRMMVCLLNSRYYPAVPCKGSLGASGDLAPLAHSALPLIGLGHCVDPENGELVSGEEVLSELGLQPLELCSKEGLALINGTQMMTAVTVLALLEAERMADAADAASAMSLEVLLGTTAPFEATITGARPHPGALETAGNLLRMMEGSEILTSHKACDRVQDAYSLRCVPQVHGASRDAMRYVRSVLEIELRSVTDNPLLSESGEFVSGGNFHGQPVALAADHLALAAAELADISERRIERLLNPDLSGLPPFLTPDPGVNSGMMIAQYTAASLVSENKVLVHPASADSIPVSGSQEDHVSMGATAARQALEVVRNSTHVIATELACAAQAAEFIHRGRHGRGTGELYRLVRTVMKPMERDRPLGGEIESVARLVAGGRVSALLKRL